MAWVQFFLAVCLLISVASSSFGGNEERFVKKYAMMKIYESCFGSEVVKQIRKEMKAACFKCAAYEPQPTPLPSPIVPQSVMPATMYPPKLDGGIAEPENTIYANAQAFDMEKLNHAILGYRPNAMPAPAYRPFSGAGYYSGYPNQAPMYYPAFYQPQQQPSYGLQPYNVPFLGQQYYGHQRTARNMDIRGQLEALTSKMSGRVKNITCVMQELGYLDDNLEPNYLKIKERIASLPVTEELRSDMQDGIAFCQQFSQCVPEVNKDKSPLSRELIRPMFFFKCYKHKKLEACIMKDVREKYVGVNDDDFDNEMEFRRNSKTLKIQNEDVDELASSVYEFLYGSDSNIDVDSFF